MTMVGFTFTRITAERKQVPESNISIQSNVGVIGLQEINSIDPKKSMLKFDFHYICRYDPGLGKVEMDGEVMEMYDKDFASKVLEHWKKETKVHPTVLQELFNTILARSNVEAIVISRDLGLPSPIQMPRVDVPNKDGEAKSSEKSKSDDKSKTDVKPEQKKK